MNAEQLKHVTVLREVDPDALGRLAAALEEKDYADGQTVFAEGDPGDGMYFIVKGRVRIEKRAQAASAVHKVLTVLDSGDYFGEMALLDQKPRSAAAVSAADSKILRLSKKAFDELQQTSSAAGLSVLFAMIRTSSDRIRRLSTQLVVYDEVGKAIGEAPDLQRLLDVILQQLTAATMADWGLLMLRSQFSDRLELRSQANLSLTETQREAVMNGEGFLEAILQNPQARRVAAFEEEELFKSSPRLGFETPSVLICPIGVDNRLLGLILLGGQQRDQFNVDGLNLVCGVARQAVQAILNARHREEDQARSRHSRQFVKF